MPYSSLKRILIVAGVLFAIGAVALLPTTWAAPNMIPEIFGQSATFKYAG